MWCIECEEEVEVKSGIHIVYIMPGIFPPHPPESEPCGGPFTSCPPPEYTEDFWDWLLKL